MDDMLTRTFNRERASATKELRLALREVHRLTEKILNHLDTAPDAALLGDDARALARFGGAAASHAGELDMATRLAFLVPTNTEET
jgi:hypothetical protein